ncbi:magnesium transporter [Rosenbergiella metrosideri]|uniref:magnesium transporter n=1 Tax=Rosenbergiella metrosideri TaxID=2921185 RepID=UPI001F4F6B96|nr:magnesium transporter [Rosenbergiella metrosideri]
MSEVYSQLLAQRRQKILELVLNNPLLVDSLLEPEKKLNDSQIEQVAQQKQLLTETVLLLHAADIADILESLPEEARQAVWQIIPVESRGRILVEASETVWESLIECMSDQQTLQAIAPLDLDDQAWLSRFLSRDLTGKLLTGLEPKQRARILQLIGKDRGGVAQVMDFNIITVRPNVTLGVVQRYLRHLKKIQSGTDKIFIIDHQNQLLGELLLTDILIHTPHAQVLDVMNPHPVTFQLDEQAENAASAFERYNLISAAVTDNEGKLIGRIAIEDIIDLVNQENENNIRKMGGIREEEDVFAPVAKSVRNRWAWLALNLCTAFVASRVIGLFENTIAHLVALATLMPIVAGIGGNTGNQTITMIVRALALRQIEPSNFSFLFLREIGVALINGILWGGVMGGITYLMYYNLALSGVMMLAMVLNLLLAAFMGVMIPLIMTKLKRDPAIGSSVLITATTDTGGFFIFLGLATLFLLH